VLTTRPEAEAFLRKVYQAHGLPTVVPTREEALETLTNSKRGPTISCPAAQTVKTVNGGPTVVKYPVATATSRKVYDKLQVTCNPESGTEFPLGATIVSCSATDSNNRTDSCTVLMRVIP